MKSVKTEQFICKQNITYNMHAPHDSAYGKGHTQVSQYKSFKFFNKLVELL